MPTITRTLKLPFLRLNRTKADEFARLQALNTKIANDILALPKKDRRALTSASFSDVEIGSAWINQTIRNAHARTQVKRFKVLPLETNTQNWTLYKVGDTYSLGFGLLRGRKKRVPLEVHQSSHTDWLELILDGTAQQGSLKLWRSGKGLWYALLSVSMEVPDAEPPMAWIGVDRGQNRIAVAGLPDGRARFWVNRQVRHLRRRFAKRRASLQAAKKTRALKKLERKEQRMIQHINHVISKQLVGLAVDTGAGLCFEDLGGIRQRIRQRKTTKTDAGQNLDYWPYYQLEQFSRYKAVAAGVPVKSRPAPYTSKSCHRCGALGIRDKHHFSCPRCGHRCDADANAGFNLSQWDGWHCSLQLETAVSVMGPAAAGEGVHDSPQNLVRAEGSGCPGSSTLEQESQAL